MERFSVLVAIIGGCSSIITFLLLIVRPLREWLLGVRQIREGVKCLLRADMLRIYYHASELRQIRQYSFENFSAMYAAYKALGGNSFIDKIGDEIKEWEVIS